MSINKYIYIYIYIYMYICLYVNVYRHMCLYIICIYIYMKIKQVPHHQPAGVVRAQTAIAALLVHH